MKRITLEVGKHGTCHRTEILSEARVAGCGYESPRCNCPDGHEELGCQDSTDTSSFLHSFTSSVSF